MDFSGFVVGCNGFVSGFGSDLGHLFSITWWLGSCYFKVTYFFLLASFLRLLFAFPKLVATASALLAVGSFVKKQLIAHGTDSVPWLPGPPDR